MTAKELVADVFAKWEAGDSSGFFDTVAEDVTWTAIGTTPISGVSRGKAEYMKKTYSPLLAVFSGHLV